MKPMIFKDRAARLAWRLYFLRAEAALSAMSGPVRRELLDDLQAHMRDILSNDRSAESEHERLRAAIARVGDPKEFLAPLVADAVLKASPKHASLAMTYRTFMVYAGRGTVSALKAGGLVLASATGVVLVTQALGFLVAPDRFGVFRVGDGQYHISLFGAAPTVGEQVLSLWSAALVAIVGAGIIAWTARHARGILRYLVAVAGAAAPP